MVEMAEDWPVVAVCIVTYDREREIKAVIRALREHFHYTGSIKWHIADDSSPQGYLGRITNEFPEIKFTHTITKRAGWGANVNKALGYLSNYPYTFLIEDDYVAKRDLDITTGVALMEAKADIAMVRYDGIAGHDTLILRLEEADSRVGKFSYMRIDKDSPHLNVYSNRPSLRHTRFHECYGWYPEGVSLGDTETQFAHRVRDKKHCGDVAILWDGIPRAFDHIGKSRQGSEADKETVKK